MCEHALASGLVSKSAETHRLSQEKVLLPGPRGSSRSSLCLSCHHTKMKRSQRPRAFTVRVVPNKSCHRHRRQLSPCACHRCSCHQTKKTIFQALPAPLLAHKKPGLVSVWRRFCGEKPAIQGGQSTLRIYQRYRIELVLLFSITLYIDNPTYIYIYQS